MPKAGELVRPRHGRGRIRHGSRPGTHAGGTGRPPSELRQRCRGSFGERIRIAEQIADGSRFRPADRLRAIDLLGRYGLGPVAEVSVDQVRDCLRLTIAAIRELLPEDQAEKLIGQLREVWE
jgi:hypothetical protein